MWDNYAEMDFPHRSNTRRLAEFPVRKAASCEARVRRRYADRGMRHAYSVVLVPITAASRWLLRFGVGAGPVRNQKERWGVGTEGITVDFIGVFGKAAKPFFYKRNFEVIIKCINRQLRTH